MWRQTSPSGTLRKGGRKQSLEDQQGPGERGGRSKGKARLWESWLCLGVHPASQAEQSGLHPECRDISEGLSGRPWGSNLHLGSMDLAAVQGAGLGVGAGGGQTAEPAEPAEATAKRTAARRGGAPHLLAPSFPVSTLGVRPLAVLGGWNCHFYLTDFYPPSISTPVLKDNESLCLTSLNPSVKPQTSTGHRLQIRCSEHERS